MFDCLTACDNVCVTCIWCMLLSTCYPKILGALRDRKYITGNDGKISSLLEYSLRLVDGKASPNPDDLMDPNCRRITIPRPPSKETI